MKISFTRLMDEFVAHLINKERVEDMDPVLSKILETSLHSFNN